MLALFEHIHRFISANRLIPAGSKVLVAYSGGSDSTFAACALKEIASVHRTRWQIELAHFHHGIDDDDDVALEIAEKNAKLFDMPLHVRHGKISERTRAPGTSLQMLARKMRYRFFLDIAREESIGLIVTAHQLDDQAETVVMRSLGGSWLTGLSGIPLRRPLAKGAKDIDVVRPLLETPHEDILTALEDLKLEYHDDATNKNTSFLRNNVRHNLMPLIIKDFNPAARQHLSALAQQAGELDVDLTARAQRLLPDLSLSDERTWIDIPLSTLSFEPRLQQRYIVREAMLQLKVPTRHATFRRVESALQLATDERRALTVQLTGETRASIHGNSLRLERTLDEQSRPPFRTTDMSATPQGGWHTEPLGSLYRTITANLVSGGYDQLQGLLDQRPSFTEYIDASKVRFPLTVRARRDGDRFTPLGMQNQKKLQDYFTDRKVSRTKRARIPLLCDADGIVWVVGHAIDERVRVTEDTRQMMRLSAETSGDETFPAIFEMDSGG